MSNSLEKEHAAESKESLVQPELETNEKYYEQAAFLEDPEDGNYFRVLNEFAKRFWSLL